MKRKDFIRKLGLGSLLVPVTISCGNSSDTDISDAACAVSPRETAGPFPTKDPGSLAIADIRVDRSGIEMIVNITIQNKNNKCAPLAGVLVDIWHCDKDGYYSEYGGSGLQQLNLQSQHFLRGRQQTDANGVASFKTIFPGWYTGRAPHIHVEILDASERSLLITQIAFPTEVCDNVYNAASQLYTRGKQDTSNTADGIFRDSLSRQLATITGSVNDGYSLSHTIVVSA